ncbi:MAG: hypothetical protein GX961_06200, partial [Firmicutes bacterium]|nr:hypothetical protein [Bacillota bacterium]
MREGVMAMEQGERHLGVVRAAKALSDPVRVQILHLISQGRSGWNLPTDEGTPD